MKQQETAAFSREAQIAQAQAMEGIGDIAGGITSGITAGMSGGGSGSADSGVDLAQGETYKRGFGIQGQMQETYTP